MSRFLGLTYKPIDKNTDRTLNALQNVILAMQKIGCQEIIPKLIYIIKFKSEKVSPNEVIKIEDAKNDLNLILNYV